jgi:hypothetical protein
MLQRREKSFPCLKGCLHKNASFVLAPGKYIYNTYWELEALKKYHWNQYTVVTYLRKGQCDIMILSTWICHCTISRLTQFVFSVDEEFSRDIFWQQSVFVVIINFFTLLLPVYILCLSAAVLFLTVCTKWNTSMCSLQSRTSKFQHSPPTAHCRCAYWHHGNEMQKFELSETEFLSLCQS